MIDVYGNPIEAGDTVKCIHNPDGRMHTVTAVEGEWLTIDGDRHIPASIAAAAWETVGYCARRMAEIRRQREHHRLRQLKALWDKADFAGIPRPCRPDLKLRAGMEARKDAMFDLDGRWEA